MRRARCLRADGARVLVDVRANLKWDGMRPSSGYAGFYGPSDAHPPFSEQFRDRFSSGWGDSAIASGK